MRNLVTISDKKYLEKGITLFESLMNTQSEKSFTLFYICLDDQTFKKIEEISKNNSHVKPIHINSVENDNFELKAHRKCTPSNEAISNGNAQGRDPSYIQFCWSLSAYMCHYFLNRVGLDNIYYLDADLFFYEDLKIFDDELDNRSIGIVRHRIDYLPGSGEYNVGIVYFKNDYQGKQCSLWWKKQLFKDPNSNPYYAWYGQCGDQKYLELFPKIFGDSVAIIDKDIGHLAPWNATFHEYKDGKVIWEGRKQTLLYFHFAHFKRDQKTNNYKTSYNNEWIWGAPELYHSFVKDKYDDYYLKTKDAIEKYKITEIDNE